MNSARLRGLAASTPVFVLGPPSAGKTTICRSIGLPFRTIDEWVPSVYSSAAQVGPMRNDQVDAALHLLMTSISTTDRMIEFAHHDYVSLIDSNLYPELKSCYIILMLAPLETCLERNALRRSPVRVGYVEASWASAHQLRERLSSENRSLEIDSSTHDLTTSTQMAISFMNRILGGR